MMKHDSAGPIRSFPPTRRILSALPIVLSVGLALAAFGAPLGTSFTYQGQLRRSGVAYNGTCNFQFSLWDAASAGTQKGPTQSISSVSVVNGLFTVMLDSTDYSTPDKTPAFTGEARWLGTSVQCSGDGAGFTQLDPRQPIIAAPYALSLRPGAEIAGPGTGPASASSTLTVRNTVGGYGLYGQGNVGVYGQGNIGLYGATIEQGYGVYGTSTGGPGSAAVYGTNSDGASISGFSTGSGPAIYGQSSSSGYAGKFVGNVDITGLLSVSLGVFSDVRGISGGVALYGAAEGTDSRGVLGRAEGPNSAGVFGYNTDSAAIWGKSGGSGSAIYGENVSDGFAGRFIGPVSVQGNLIVQGTLVKSSGTFRIDHPLDPANKFLSHSFVESPDMKNIYDGNITTDASGSAIVTLPDYFEALNRDFRYQLTVLGQFAQAIVSREIAGNSFEIHTDKPGVKVSWQVTGIRQDAYAEANPIVVEQAKPAAEQGMYLYPAGFGAGEEKRIGHLNGPASKPGAPDPSGAIPNDQPSK
jgi:hypothetical protein